MLEKAAEFGEIGYGVQMGPNAYRMMQLLGVTKALEPLAVFPDALVMMDAVSGEEITRIALGEVFVRRYGCRYCFIQRRDLQGTLFEACRQPEEIAREVSKGLAKFESRDDGVVVTCEDGSQYFGAALVGADGLWSPTRKQIVNDAPRVAGHVAYRGVVTAGKITVIWCGHNMHLVQYPLRGGTLVNNVALLESPSFLRGEKEFGGAGDRVIEEIRRMGQEAMQAWASRQVEKSEQELRQKGGVSAWLTPREQDTDLWGYDARRCRHGGTKALGVRHPGGCPHPHPCRGRWRSVDSRSLAIADYTSGKMGRLS